MNRADVTVLFACVPSSCRHTCCVFSVLYVCVRMCLQTCSVNTCVCVCVFNVCVCVFCLACGGGFRPSDRSVLNSSDQNTSTIEQNYSLQLKCLKTSKNTFVDDLQLVTLNLHMTQCLSKHVYYVLNSHFSNIIRINTKYSHRISAEIFQQSKYTDSYVAPVCTSHALLLLLHTTHRDKHQFLKQKSLKDSKLYSLH